MLGRNLKLIRVARGLEAADVARASNISASYLSLIESGKRAPSQRVVRAVARELRVPVEVLFWEPDGARPGDRKGRELPPEAYDLIEILFEILTDGGDGGANGPASGTGKKKGLSADG